MSARTGYHRWTDAERDYLRRNYGKMSRQAIAAHMGLRENQIKGMAQKMSLQSKNNPHFHKVPVGKKPIKPIPPAVKTRLARMPVVPVNVLLQGKDAYKGRRSQMLYLAALVVAVGVRRSS